MTTEWLGPYQLLGPLGAGGMGAVYKARDSRLDRLVAIKVLPERFADDPQRRERFEREARAVAALNHPHICQLYDVGSADAPSGAAGPRRFLVMEYLEGQSLEDRLVAGPLPIAEALRIAIDLAGALDHAHRRGLVHRDVKPANVMLTSAGAGSAGSPQAKLLDFGISRLQAPADLPALDTVTEDRAPLTAEGTVLGTYPYMSPEQLAGREADARSDIFAFGAVLYEMITGQRAFQGTTAATLIGAILHGDPPPLAARQPLAPLGLDRIVTRCLAKDPDNRWQTARDLAIELTWIAEHSSSPADAAGRRLPALPVLAVAAAAIAVLAIAAAVSSVGLLRAEPEPPPVVHLPLAPPDGVDADTFSTIGPVIVAPDGRQLVYAWAGPDGRQLLWLRALDSLAARPLADTDGGAYPFWSPDSRSIGFFARGKLKKIHVDGGPAQILCDARQPRGGTWSVGDVILFSAGAGHELYRVRAGGGAVTALPADGINRDRNQPSFLPDGTHFVYAGRPDLPGVFLGSLDASAATRLVDGSVVAWVPGYLLLLRGAGPSSTAMTLLAQPFDAAARQVRGDPEALADRILVDSLQALGYFSASHTGTLVYTNAASLTTRLMWFDRRGSPLGAAGSGASFSQPSLSRDGRSIAVRRIDPETQNSDIWLIDSTSGLSTRLTQGEFSSRPLWSPDGSSIVFISQRRRAPPNLYFKSLSASVEEQRLFESHLVNHTTDWSRDGRFVVYSTQNPANGWDVMVLPMSGSESERQPRPYLSTEFDEHFGRVSPDGRWLAYMSDESGVNEIYVQSFPSPGAKQRISVAGGVEPVWRGDGTELYYVAPDETLMAVPVAKGPTLRPGAAMPLFKTRFSRRIIRRFQFDPTYAVSNDGQRFLITTVTDEIGSVPTKILFNWPSAARN